jgi:SAM-dependent methyltransferase
MRLWKRAAKSETIESALAEYAKIKPDAQNAFDLFTGSWSTKFDDAVTRGTFDGLHDPRIVWLSEQFDLGSKRVLELGPLEAAHTAMLERAGADVLAIEANKGAFLRCLVAKNHLGLRARFLLGDFELHDFGVDSFDLIVASGVLYHMRDPAKLLQRLSLASKRLFLWTHYIEPDVTKWNPCLSKELVSGKWDRVRRLPGPYGSPEVRRFAGVVRLLRRNRSLFELDLPRRLVGAARAFGFWNCAIGL